VTHDRASHFRDLATSGSSLQRQWKFGLIARRLTKQKKRRTCWRPRYAPKESHARTPGEPMRDAKRRGRSTKLGNDLERDVSRKPLITIWPRRSCASLARWGALRTRIGARQGDSVRKGFIDEALRAFVSSAKCRPTEEAYPSRRNGAKRLRKSDVDGKPSSTRPTPDDRDVREAVWPKQAQCEIIQRLAEHGKARATAKPSLVRSTGDR